MSQCGVHNLSVFTKSKVAIFLYNRECMNFNNFIIKNRYDFKLNIIKEVVSNVWQ